MLSCLRARPSTIPGGRRTNYSANKLIEGTCASMLNCLSAWSSTAHSGAPYEIDTTQGGLGSFANWKRRRRRRKTVMTRLRCDPSPNFCFV